MTMIEVMCCPINYPHEAVINKTAPRGGAGVVKDKSRSFTFQQLHCGEREQQKGTCSQPTGDESWEKERRQRMDGITHETAEEGFRQREEGRWRARRVSAQNMSTE